MLTLWFGFILFILGACIASFLAVAVERPMRGESITNPPSHCACGRPLKSYENIPIFGWLRIKGTTKCCNTKLPKRYVITELFLGVYFATLTPFALFSLERMTWGVSGWLALSVGLVGIGIVVAVLVLLALKDRTDKMASMLQ